ncbi:glycosyltransferase family 39 protein [Methanolobus sp. WCC4]|uniref:ArnT family glycosyltransferase n=1 Tax=Methanolobus sp. WCC4 TaxID=3125784 RepID=UPI0030FC59A5
MNDKIILDKKIFALIIIASLYIAARLYFASISSYGFYHGWNEAHYSNIAKNYFTHTIWYQIPLIGGPVFDSLPPFYSYMVYVSFKVFGISDMSARLVSIFAEILAVGAIYLLAKEIFGERTAILSSVIFLVLPWNILWFGRVFTDPLMTALLTASIASYVHAYKNNGSMLPFGIFFGLAVFTKQPALVILPIVIIWSLIVGPKRELLIKGAISAAVGLLPLLLWLGHYFIEGDMSFLSQILYGELANRSAPFSNSVKVIALTTIGLSPLILLLATYGSTKCKKESSVLFIWLVLYGIFVIIRTPPSHEYYSLPLTPVFAVLAAKGVLDISKIKVFNKWSPSRSLSFIVIFIVLSTLPITYALLSYSGDIGYTCTEDVGNYLNEYMDQHPEEIVLIVTPSRYVPQMVWYANLTSIGHSRRQVYGISNDLSSASIKNIEDITKKNDDAQIFLVVDNRQGFASKLDHSYEKIYETTYITKIPNMADVYTTENSYEKYFNQSLLIYDIEI